jgi:hypothetical protein
MTDIEPDNITAEKSLWAVWKMAHRVRRNRFNRICAILVICVMGLYVCVSKQTPREIADMDVGLANVGLGFAATILGFLVAGFTIFATLARPSLLAAMAQHTEDHSGLSYLKYNFSVFFETFGWYLGFAGLCIAVLILGAAGGVATQLIGLLPNQLQLVFDRILPRLCAFLIGVLFVVVCLELKSFIFNIYHVVMTSIRWSVEYPDGDSCRYLPPKEATDQQKPSAARQES